MKDLPPGLLALEDGTLWPGRGFGADRDGEGEIVFNTSLTGYQEILTDPSYQGQLVTMTVPHIGNTGINERDVESDRIWATALIIRDLSPLASNWRATGDLGSWLASRGVPGLAGVETRALVRHLRDRGAMRAALSTTDPDPERLVERARRARDMTGLDLVREVTCGETFVWDDAGDAFIQDSSRPAPGGPRSRPLHVVAYDFGMKRNILHMLAARGCRITVVPAATAAEEVLDLEPDGIFLSNGPGDPAAVTYAVENVRKLLGRRPLFGICLGHQILALALGARTYKLKFGHHGGNQPVRAAGGGRVEITAHNHGFAVDARTLPPGVENAQINLNDHCCEGLRAPDLRAFSVQYHPESSPGPHDSDRHFDAFIHLMTGGAPERGHV